MSIRGNPTKAEARWMRDIAEIGCIACVVGHGVYGTPGEVHHILDESHRRIGHLDSLYLCSPGHHRGATRQSGKISRHPWKYRFEKAYGTEQSLLEKTRELVKAKRAREGQACVSP